MVLLNNPPVSHTRVRLRARSSATARTLSCTFRASASMAATFAASGKDDESIAHTVPSGGRVPSAKNARRCCVVHVEDIAVEQCCSDAAGERVSAGGGTRTRGHGTYPGPVLDEQSGVLTHPAEHVLSVCERRHRVELWKRGDQRPHTARAEFEATPGDAPCCL